MARATPHRCTRQRKNVVDEQQAVESSSSSSALPTSRRKRQSPTPEKENGFCDEVPESTTSEDHVTSRKKIKRSAPSRSKFAGKGVKEEKDQEVCEKSVSNSSKKKKEASAKKPLNIPHNDQEQDGMNEVKDLEECEKPVASSSKKKTRGSAKQNVKVEREDTGQKEIKEVIDLGACEEPVSSSSNKKKRTSTELPGKEKHKDSEHDVLKEEENTEACLEPMESSTKKIKGAFPKQPVVVDDDEESVCYFIGDPVPLDKAQSRWPERYTKKTNMRRSISSSVSKNGDEDEPVKAKCHYYQAMVDGITYSLNDHAHVKAGDGEPNFVGRIIEFFETIDGKLYFRAQWFYKAVDTVISYHSKDHDERRVFLSEDQNDNDLNCIVAKITIARITSNICMTTKSDEIPECDYYYDMSYSTAYSTFANISKDDRSDVSSLSTTLSNEIGEREAPAMNATLLDLYSGCGAMSTGLCQGAHLVGLNLLTTWAVDLNSFACESLRLNHPKTKVRNEKAEDFLTLLREWKKLCEKFSLDVNHPPKQSTEEYELGDGYDNDDSSPLPNGEFEVDHFVDVCYGDPNNIGKKELMFKVRWKGYGPSEDTWEPNSGLRKCSERIEAFVRKGYKNHILPLPGFVDVICGGPPCQGISGFNRFRDSNNPLADVRNQQMAVFMEIVDFLKPKYVLMENVVDILKFAEGFLGRFALSKLVQMNYQVRLGIMAAGCYGLPQFRMRVFLWGARPTEVIPQFPLPTHDVLVRGGAPVKFENNVVAYNEDQKVVLPTALLLGDAISDLPKVENNEGRDEMPYGEPPKTDFQYSIRLTASDSMDPCCNPKKSLLHDTLFDHRPLQLNEDDYLRVCRVPKKKGANFRDFPGVRVGPNNTVEFDPEVERVLLPSGNPLVPDYAMSFIKGRSTKPFGRLWWDETVPTVVTRAEPHNQVILHPEQDRVLTIRENARLQGFPDHYKLCGPIKERYIQVGNAVAVPVSRALGYSLGRAFLGQSGEEPVFTLPTNFPQFGIEAGEAMN
ncbi:DNA (cytosine-5)-methyltransferase 1 isoform X1 [Dendrobium catenatum]|uniref:DNA (cytosine-5)-methyltransferase 1 isoform X1 n=1 Tax=Dendrobium catenatum TaxID=906689 RepID=UPI0009F57EA4|nr:DNA (cytosine-5)-methyltransferase 1 isoform X1 [Dendrobium catenatum]